MISNVEDERPSVEKLLKRYALYMSREGRLILAGNYESNNLIVLTTIYSSRYYFFNSQGLHLLLPCLSRKTEGLGPLTS